MKRWKWWMVIALAVSMASCGSDSADKTDPSDPQNCAAGQSWNPILARCVDDAANNVSPNNVSPNNVSPNNVSPNNVSPNNVSPNNSNTNGTNNNSTNNMNNNTVPPMPCGTGALIGKTCGPSGAPLAAADVTISGVDCATGMPFEMMTRTMADGTFDFADVPSGQHQLSIETGSFNSMRQVLIQKDMTTDLTSAADKVCLDQNVNIAVIQGAYDHVEGVLEPLNLTFDIVGSDALTDSQAQSFLTNLQAMNAYDIIFINCGDLFDNLSLLDFTGQTMMTIASNLRAYVQGGKSLYVSDWAAPFIEAAFPDMIDFLGANDNDHVAARDGYAPQTIMSSVLTPELQGVLGRNTATIEFPQDTGATPPVINNNWAVAVGVGANATVQIQGDTDLCAGAGYSCSGVDGSQAAAPLLVTYKDPSGGAVVFTSFHNERQSALNQDMERILRFLIFQL